MASRSRTVVRRSRPAQAPTPAGLAPRPFAERGAAPAPATGGPAHHVADVDLGGPQVQPKLRLAPAGDGFERAADAAAAAALGDGAAPALQPLPAGHGAEVPADVAEGIGAARGGGRPLPRDVQAPLEESLGADLGGVRVHDDARAAGMSGALAARAFTSGADIFFGRGEYAPGEPEGRALLAHELAHTVQQSADGTPGAVQRGPLNWLARTAVFGTSGSRREIPETSVPDPEKHPGIAEVEEVAIQSTDNNILRGRFYRSGKKDEDNPGTGKTVLFLSGSGGSAEKYSLDVAAHYTKVGADVLAVNYRGFGGSGKVGRGVGRGGKPTEEGLIDDAVAIFSWLQKEKDVRSWNIIVHGYSLGGAVAAQLVARVGSASLSLGGLVLHSAMPSVEFVAKSMAGEKLGKLGAKKSGATFDTATALTTAATSPVFASMPVLFMSGAADEDHLSLTKTGLDKQVSLGNQDFWESSEGNHAAIASHFSPRAREKLRRVLDPSIPKQVEP